MYWEWLSHDRLSRSIGLYFRPRTQWDCSFATLQALFICIAADRTTLKIESPVLSCLQNRCYCVAFCSIFSTFSCRISVLAPLVRAGLVHLAEVGECSGVFPKNGSSSLSWYNLCHQQRLYQDNKLNPFFGNTHLHSTTSAGWTSTALTRGPTVDSLMCQEWNKTGRSCNCFCRDERTGLDLSKVLRSIAKQVKSELSLAKKQYCWVRAPKYYTISPLSRWLAESFPIHVVLLNNAIGSHSANQRLGGLIWRTSERWAHWAIDR